VRVDAADLGGTAHVVQFLDGAGADLAAALDRDDAEPALVSSGWLSSSRTSSR